MLFDPKWNLPETPAITIEPWQKLLLDAADLIDKNGWVKEVYSSKAGFCVVGAISRAYVNTFKDESEVFNTARDKFFHHIGRRTIIMWNDTTPGLNKQKVVRTLREAAGIPDSSTGTGR